MLDWPDAPRPLDPCVERVAWVLLGLACLPRWCAVTRDQQIRKALELLAPSPRERGECQYEIGLALDRVGRGAAAARSFRVANSRKARRDCRRYRAALRRLQNAYNSLDPAIRPWFSLSEGYAAEKLTVIAREIAKTKAFLDWPSPTLRRDASRNKAAVAAAHDLLEWRDQKVTVTRGGKWARLAQILAGDPPVGLFDHLREFKRSPGPTVKKVRGAHSIAYLTDRR